MPPKKLTFIDKLIEMQNTLGVLCIFSTILFFLLLFGDGKNLPNIYELLQKYGNEAQAIKWAKQLEINHIDVGTSPFKANPCTLVYKLVEELNKYKT